MGKIGEYIVTVPFGAGTAEQSRFELFRFTMSDPVKPVLIQLDG
jgi:hypothetical protein